MTVTDAHATKLGKIRDEIVWTEAEILKAMAKADSSKTEKTRAKWEAKATDFRTKAKALRAERHAIMHDAHAKGASYGAIAKVLDLSTTYVRKTVMALNEAA